jgi:hypothetical protein
MAHDEKKVDDAVLALWALWVFKDGPGWRASRSFDWEVADRLHAAGLISDPRGKARSVLLSADGLERGRTLCKELFGSF